MTDLIRQVYYYHFKPERIYQSPVLTTRQGERMIVEIQLGPMEYETIYDDDTHKITLQVRQPAKYVGYRLDAK